jgi:hypothetical protein
MKPKNEVTRSLIVDKETWEESMRYARRRYRMSLSKVVENLLQEWLEKERKRPLENEKQERLF